ncbi:MAG: VOC family protein [Hyphomonadaceae bacterium]
MPNPSRIVSRNLLASRRFYAAAARPLGLTVMDAAEGFIVGRAGRGVLLRVSDRAAADAPGDFESPPETRPALVALEAADSSSVRAFYREAIRHGGETLAYPSVHAAGAGRYAARVSDPDGNCIECVLPV